jgi:PAS domain S-box-containing protein
MSSDRLRLPADAPEMEARVREHSWAASGLGPAEQWPPILKAMLKVVLRMPQPASVCWGTNACILYNDSYRKILGDKHPSALGEPLVQVWSEITDVVAPAIKAVLTGEPQLWDDVPLHIGGRGEDRTPGWFVASWTPIFQDDGSIGGFLMVANETTSRHQAEARLRERESDLARVQSVARVGGLNIQIAEGLRSWRSPEYLNLHGLPQETLQEAHEDWRNRVHPDDRDAAEAVLFAALEGAASTYENEYRIVRPSDGTIRWLHVRADIERSSTGEAVRLVGAHVDITEQCEAQEALRRSEESHAFLLRLSDALRPLSDAEAIQAATCQILGEYLAADWTHYCDIDIERGTISNARDHFRIVDPSHIGQYDLASLPVHAQSWGDGRSVAINDADSDRDLGPQERRGLRARSVRAALTTPIRKDGMLKAVLAVLNKTPRQWSDEDVAAVEAAAERTWAAIERANTESALRRSQARFRDFGAASSDGLWIRSADTLGLEYASPAMKTIYGDGVAALDPDVRAWAGLIVPEDRHLALQHLEDLRSGKSVVQEFRIQQPVGGAFRWIRSTGFPLHGPDGQVERIAGISSDLTEAKLATERQAILVAELQHRVRNIMATTRSIFTRSGERAESVPDYVERMSGRLLALSRVQALITRGAERGVDLASLVAEEVRARAAHDDQYTLTGVDVELSPKAAEVLNLAIHELATNALKHGALSAPSGTVAVTWALSDRSGANWLTLDWEESGGPPPGAEETLRRGFGSDLIEARIPYELGGSGHITFAPSGVRCRLEFPLTKGASTLQTDVPARAGIYDGVLNMAGQPDLTNCTVMVVEDEYYMALDTARALQAAGASVLGPLANEETARGLLDAMRPDAVVLDINLGAGPSFKLAEQLQELGVPFLFVTGYDGQIVPEQLGDVLRLEKPVQFRRIVRAVAHLVGRGG